MTTTELQPVVTPSARRLHVIVIVDDSPEDRAEIRRLLITQNPRRYQFFEADTGAAGLRMVIDKDGRPPYCVVLDHNLPDLDAPAILAALTDEEGVLYCPVVVLTGKADGLAGRNVLRAGAQDFIGKSWMTPEGLTRAVENAVERFSMLRELRVKNAAINEMQVQTADLLRDVARRKDEFLATLAHELRNPLAPLRTGLEMMQLMGEPATAELRAMMERQLQNLVRLVDDLLDVSRISNDKISIKPDIIALQAVIESAVETSRPQIVSAKHELTVNVPDDSVWIFGDLMRLAQVVGNLLNNAAKYTTRDGNIVLTVSLDADEVIIEVADDGIGMSAETLLTVFDLFSQADHVHDRSMGGLGIGLTLVRRFVEMHGGTVRAESAGLGAGSTFTVRLPAVAAPDVSMTQLPPIVKSAPARQQRILVVDDNVDAAEALSAMLRLSGHVVCVSHDGNDALAIARTFNPQAGFIDLGLPGLSGELLAQALRTDPACGRMLLVAVTGWGTEEDKRKTKLAGFDAHLTKPAQRERVLECLSQLN